MVEEEIRMSELRYYSGEWCEYLKMVVEKITGKEVEQEQVVQRANPDDFPNKAGIISSVMKI